MKDNKYKFINAMNVRKIFYEILKILHPFAPYISEELWYILNDKCNSLIIMEKYPERERKMKYNNYLNHVSLLKKICFEVRNISGNLCKNNFFLIFKNIDIKKLRIIEKIRIMFKHILKIKDILIFLTPNNITFFEINILKTGKILIPKKKNIDINNFKNIVYKIEKIDKEIKQLKSTLKNENFLNKAKKNIIKKKKSKLSFLIYKRKSIIDNSN